MLKIKINRNNSYLQNMINPSYYMNKGGDNMKQDVQTARRNLKSPNIKTRKRALKIIKQHKRK